MMMSSCMQNWSVNLGSFNDHVTKETASSPTANDDVAEEDTPPEHNDASHAPGMTKQQKRKKKNQSLREMVTYVYTVP